MLEVISSISLNILLKQISFSSYFVLFFFLLRPILRLYIKSFHIQSKKARDTKRLIVYINDCFFSLQLVDFKYRNDNILIEIYKQTSIEILTAFALINRSFNRSVKIDLTDSDGKSFKIAEHLS